MINFNHPKVIAVSGILNQPGLYAWFRGKECLYIGRTMNGLRRLLRHEVIDRVDKVRPTDVFKFFPLGPLAYTNELVWLEHYLIHRYQPKYNKFMLSSRALEYWLSGNDGKLPRKKRGVGPREYRLGFSKRT